MNSFINYSFQSGICLTILFLFYHLVLRKEKCFSYNRFYLIAAPLVAFLLPLLKVPFVVAQPDETMELVFQLPALVTEVTTLVEPQQNSELLWIKLVLVVYSTGVLILIGSFLNNIRKVVLITNSDKTSSAKVGNYTLVFTNGTAPTFAFLNYLFLDNSQNFRQTELEQILDHEETHIKQGHSWDILLIEALSIAFWFNPLFILIKKAIKENHEFLADQYASKLTDKVEYVRLVLHQLSNANEHSLRSYFSLAITKRRIKMITSEKGRFLWMRAWMGAPLLFLLFFTFSCQQQFLDIDEVMIEVDENKINPKVPARFLQKISELEISNDSKNYYFRTTTDLDLDFLKDEEYVLYRIEYSDQLTLAEFKKYLLGLPTNDINPNDLFGLILSFDQGFSVPQITFDENIYTNVDVMPMPWKGEKGIEDRISQSLEYPEEAINKGVEGVVYVSYVINPFGNIIHSNLVKGISYPQDPELADKMNGKALMAVTATSGLWKSGELQGNPVNVLQVRPVVFKLN